MDSKVVNREIKKYIWPVLKEAGFATFSPRTAWRHGSEKIDVVSFQSFNRYNADVLGTTTFSFVVRLGSLPLYVPPQWPPKSKNGKQLPSDAECYFRGVLECSIDSRHSDKTIWPVDSEGKNLAWCVQGVLRKIPEALAWFDRLESKQEVLSILLRKEDENMSELWGFGRNPSPIRSYLTGYVALSIGDRQLAQEKLQEAVHSKCFVNLFTGLEGAMSRAV